MTSRRSLGFSVLFFGPALLVVSSGCGSSDDSKSPGTGGSGATSSGGSGATSSGGSGATSSGGSGATSSGGSGGGSGCSLPTCTSTAANECAFQPCMATDSGTNYCYPQAASASECTSGSTPETADVNGMPRTLCVPSGCPSPTTYVP